MIDLSISIVNTSNWKYLEPCLRAIINNVHDIHYEILVVDNVSDDGSQEKIKEFFPEVILTINSQRYGFAKNNNINLRKGSGRYLMLLNDDTLVQPGSIDCAIKFLDENPGVGMVGCKMISPDGSFQLSSARRFRTLWSTLLSETGIRNRFIHHPLLDQDFIKVKTDDQVVEVDLPQESGMVVRRDVLDDVGLLDEQFFMFGEGADWCRRIKQAGWKIVFLAGCPITHYGGVTNKRSSIRMFIQHYKSIYLYFNKESKVNGEFYRLIIILLYTVKSFIGRLIALTNIRRNEVDLGNEYYGAVLDLMLFRLDDPTYPFPT